MADETTNLTGDPLNPAEPAAVTDEPEEQVRPPHDRSRQAALIAAGLSVLAGVLCVVAPLQAVYTLQRTISGRRISISIDGWGRYSLALSQHGPRYGIVFTVAAVVLVLSAATRIANLRKEGGATTTGDDRLAQSLAVAVAAVIGGAWGMVALDVNATASNASSGDSAVNVGSFVWVSFAAWVASVLALYVPWVEARRRF